MLGQKEEAATYLAAAKEMAAKWQQMAADGDHYKLTFDKAGSYGIQERIGLIGIERINGSYTNVVGLPTEKLYRELMKL